jgi:hypothetical protein
MVMPSGGGRISWLLLKAPAASHALLRDILKFEPDLKQHHNLLACRHSKQTRFSLWHKE